MYIGKLYRSYFPFSIRNTPSNKLEEVVIKLLYSFFQINYKAFAHEMCVGMNIICM